jgi:hypothetical protein
MLKKLYLSFQNLEIKCQQKVQFDTPIVNYKFKKSTSGLFTKFYYMIDISIVNITGFDLTKSEFV